MSLRFGSLEKLVGVLKPSNNVIQLRDCRFRPRTASGGISQNIQHMPHVIMCC